MSNGEKEKITDVKIIKTKEDFNAVADPIDANLADIIELIKAADYPHYFSFTVEKPGMMPNLSVAITWYPDAGAENEGSLGRYEYVERKVIKLPGGPPPRMSKDWPTPQELADRLEYMLSQSGGGRRRRRAKTKRQTKRKSKKSKRSRSRRN